MTYARSKECILLHNGILGSNPTLRMNICNFSLSLSLSLSLYIYIYIYIYTHTHTHTHIHTHTYTHIKALQWDDPPTSTFHQISINDTLEIPVTEYLERVNGMDQNIMLTF